MLDIKRIRNDFDEVAQKLATRGVAAEKLTELMTNAVNCLSNQNQQKLNVTQLLLLSLKRNATKKMHLNKSQRCKLYQLKSKQLTLN